MNTRIRYEYRDASGYHWDGAVVVTGEMTPDLWRRVRNACDAEQFFIASQVGFPEVFGFKPGPHHTEPERVATGYEATACDHCWHGLAPEPRAWELTDEVPTEERTVEALVAAFESAARSGWAVFDPGGER